MELTAASLEQYATQGFLFFPALLGAADLAPMRACLSQVFSEASPRRVLEKDGVTVRSVYGMHRSHPVFDRLTRDARLLGPSRQLLAGPVYVHQFKLNAKASFSGDVWEWHQDFIFWHNEDGVARAALVTAVVFLDEVHEFNGPIAFIPGSHAEQMIDVAARKQRPSGYADREAWIGNLTAEINYAVPLPTVARLSRQCGLVAPKGPAGSVLFFHPNLVHASASNISATDRVLALITYNAVGNEPAQRPDPRPDFLCAQDCAPVTAEEPAAARAKDTA
jgi:ectoine hydroxylase